MKQNNDVLRFIALILTVLLFWFWGWIYVDKFIPIDERAAFGDKFGFTNSIFSGLALAVIIYSIILQQKELNLQRQELADTRAEFKDQNFQTTFFNLLQTQQQIANDINITITNLHSYDKYQHKPVKGREFFVNSKIEMKRIALALRHPVYIKYSEWDEYDAHYNEPDNEIEEENLTKTRKISYTLKYYNIDETQWENSKTLEPTNFARLCYKIFFKKFQYAVGHYFRHLYHILLFLEETEKTKGEKINDTKTEETKLEFQRYANFVQAQMATPELFLLFYNSLYFNKIQKIIIKYNILENLYMEDLLEPQHNSVDGITLKSLNNID